MEPENVSGSDSGAGKVAGVASKTLSGHHSKHFPGSPKFQCSIKDPSNNGGKNNDGKSIELLLQSFHWTMHIGSIACFCTIFGYFLMNCCSTIDVGKISPHWIIKDKYASEDPSYDAIGASSCPGLLFFTALSITD